MAGDGWGWLELAGDGQRRPEIAGDSGRYLEMAGDGWRHSKMAGDAWRCLEMPGDADLVTRRWLEMYERTIHSMHFQEFDEICLVVPNATATPASS